MSHDPPDRDRARDPARDREPEGFRDLFEPGHLARLFLSEPTLWPVLATALVIGLTLGTALFVLWLDGGNPFAAAALAILVVVTLRGLWDALRQRRLSPARIAWLAAWAFCGGLGWWLARVGLGRLGGGP